MTPLSLVISKSKDLFYVKSTKAEYFNIMKYSPFFQEKKHIITQKDLRNHLANPPHFRNENLRLKTNQFRLRIRFQFPNLVVQGSILSQSVRNVYT